ncbi:MAG: ATP-binding protein, partial [Chloroflexia bacterium]|nr:ATP-binding protein [Chloroflexia bacterium]
SEEAAVIGVVDEPRRYSDLRSFLDDYFDRHVEQALAEEAPTRRPEILVFTVTVLATKHLRDDVTSNRPAVSGPIYFGTKDAIEYALGVAKFSGAKVPALMHVNGNYDRDEGGEIVRDEHGREQFQRTPLYLDEDYLLGPEAGHANWTGQSGLATKTSHALFLISSVFQTMERKGTSVAALMFNVKGPDLLWLDKPAQPTAELDGIYAAGGWKGLSERDGTAYRSLELEPHPFANLRLFAPFKLNQAPEAHNGVIDLGNFRQYTDLNTLRNAPGETECVHPILWSLETALWYPHRVFDRNDLDDKFWGFLYHLRERKVKSMHELTKLFAEIDGFFEAHPESSEWDGHHKATIRKAKNRLQGVSNKLGGLMAEGTVKYGGLPQATDAFGNHELRVVDISNCNSTAQELIVTSVIGAAWRMAEKGELNVDKLVVFVDELNKYAPAGGEGGLRDTLVDIAARGRHLNVVLFGAQQFRSKVDSEILGNCGTSLYGRVGDEEITNSAYRSLTETAKAELLGLQKGRLLVRHAHFRAPLFGSFPHPPTIPGMVGQRIFNQERRTHPADGLFRVLQRLMTTKAPPKSEVLTAAAGADSDAIDALCRKLERLYTNQPNGRGNPWQIAKRELDIVRQLRGQG